MVNKKFVLIGANSEIAQELITFLLKLNFKVYVVSRKEIEIFKSCHGTLFIDSYIKDLNKIISFLKEIEIFTIIFFNGILFENRPKKFPSENEIRLTFEVNYLIPYTLTEKILSSNLLVEKYIYLSSIAAVRPRYKNFIYGSSKRLLEINIKNLIKTPYLIIRFGLVKTKMSRGHKIPPFSLTSFEAANIIANYLHKEKIIYPNFKLKILSNFLKIIPTYIFQKIKM